MFSKTNQTFFHVVFIFLFIDILFFTKSVFPCTIAVVSSKATVDGKPVLMKNRDDSDAWEQEVKFYEAENPTAGSNISVVKWGKATFLSPYPDTINAGGANEAGLAITNTNVVGINPLHEMTNSLIELLNNALETCATVDDFENLLETWHYNNRTKTVNGVFGMIDAHGGAAIFEVTSRYIGSPLLYERFNADDAFDENGNFLGYIVRTNDHQWGIYEGGVDREKRTNEILKELSLNDSLSYTSLMQDVARDVCGDIEKKYRDQDPSAIGSGVNNSKGNIYATSTYIDNFYTGFCISRYNTSSSIVVQGVEENGNPALTTMWVSLGEPSVGIFTPYFPASKRVPPYAWADEIPEHNNIVDESSASVLNSAIVETGELSVYSNNILSYADIDGRKRYAMDKTINYEKVMELQQWILPLENIIIKNTEDYLDCLRNNSPFINSEDLFSFSDYATTYAYKNYIGFKEVYSDYSDWNFKNSCSRVSQ